MKIIYIGRHFQTNSNDDEGAVTFALEKLGHEVVRIHESNAGIISLDSDLPTLKGGFLLCHHWHALDILRQIKIPKVFWTFDLIDWPNGGARHQQRKAWMRELTDVCDIGFMSDGDWVANDKTGKLYWLTQGADEREMPVKCVGTDIKLVDVLFVGGIGYGRDKFVQELRERYGDRFKHILKGCHGAALVDEINRAKIVVAPDSPVTDHYWSNRVYNVLRLGGFLLHPWSEGLERQYGNFVGWYKTRDQLHRLIKWALGLEQAALDRNAASSKMLTEERHTYRHRCEVLVQTVKERLGI